MNNPFNKLTRYWLKSVRLCFAQLAETSGFMFVYRHNIWVTEIMIDHFDRIAVAAFIKILPSSDCDHLKNPIDNSNPETARLRPAVSPLEACPTSAL